MDVLTPDSVASARDETEQVFEKISGLSPAVSDAVTLSRQARYDSDNAWYRYQTSQPGVSLKRNPQLLEAAQKSSQDAAAAEQLLDQATKDSGNPDAYKELVAARQRLAKIGVVEQSMSEGGEVDARVIGKLYKKGYPITDELATIGKFSNEFPDVMKRASSLSKQPGVSRSGGLLPMVGAGVGGTIAGGAGAAVGAVAPAMAGSAARNFALSSLAQRMLAVPNYGTPNPSYLARLLSQGSMQAGQQYQPSQ